MTSVLSRPWCVCRSVLLTLRVFVEAAARDPALLPAPFASDIPLICQRPPAWQQHIRVAEEDPRFHQVSPLEWGISDNELYDGLPEFNWDPLYSLTSPMAAPAASSSSASASHGESAGLPSGTRASGNSAPPPPVDVIAAAYGPSTTGCPRYNRTVVPRRLCCHACKIIFW